MGDDPHIFLTGTPNLHAYFKIPLEETQKLLCVQILVLLLITMMRVYLLYAMPIGQRISATKLKLMRIPKMLFFGSYKMRLKLCEIKWLRMDQRKKNLMMTILKKGK